MLESDNQKQIINRLRRVEGQLRGIQKMIAEEKDCVNIVTQLSAVRSGIDRTMGIIVAEHPNDNPEEQLEKMEQAIQMVIKK